MEQLIYFASAHTAAGYRDLLATNISDCQSVFFIEGATLKERSNCIRQFFEKWRARGDKLELILNNLDPTMLTGVINRQLSCAVIDRAAHPDFDIKSLASHSQLIDLNKSMIPRNESDREQVVESQRNKDQAIEDAHQAFHTALKIHDDLEKIFIHAMDFKKADRVAEDLIEEIFKDQKSANKEPLLRRRFLGASTAQGVVDYVDQLTEHLTKRYLIKGRAGSGKSTLLRKVVDEAVERSYSTEIYHCGFDPDSLDMVIIRELGIAIFDSTAPHEYEATRHGDQIVDLYETTISPGTDEKYQDEISRLTKSYKQEIDKAVTHLAKALEQNEKIETIKQNLIDLTLFEQQITTLSEQVEQIQTN